MLPGVIGCVDEIGVTISNRLSQQFFRAYLLRRQQGSVRLILTAGVMLAAIAALVVCGVGIRASRSLGGVWTRACLNEMMGLPDRSDDMCPNPLSGTLPVTPAVMERFKTLADLAAQRLPDRHSDNVEVTALVGLQHDSGWPFTSYEVGAIVYISDQPPGMPRRGIAQFKVNDSGGSPFRWQGMMGNLLVFFIAALPLLWLFDVIMIRFARRSMKNVHAFPTKMRDESL